MTFMFMYICTMYAYLRHLLRMVWVTERGGARPGSQYVCVGVSVSVSESVSVSRCQCQHVYMYCTSTHYTSIYKARLPQDSHFSIFR